MRGRLVVGQKRILVVEKESRAKWSFDPRLVHAIDGEERVSREDGFVSTCEPHLAISIHVYVLELEREVFATATASIT